jgi:hypothetical protein
MTAFVSYPPVVTLYAAVDAGALSLYDTTSQFNLNGPAPSATVDNVVKYTLPGLPFDIRVPIERLLIVTAESGGVASVGPLDYSRRPVPELGDFRGVLLYSVGDFALVMWTGFLWTIVETGGPTVGIATAEQYPL